MAADQSATAILAQFLSDARQRLSAALNSQGKVRAIRQSTAFAVTEWIAECEAVEAQLASLTAANLSSQEAREVHTAETVIAGVNVIGRFRKLLSDTAFGEEFSPDLRTAFDALETASQKAQNDIRATFAGHGGLAHLESQVLQHLGVNER